MNKRVWLAIVGVVVAAVAVSIIALPKGPQWTTTSPEALEEFERGMAAAKKLYHDDAIAHLKRAIELDPEFVSAKVMLADMGKMDHEPREDLIEEMKQIGHQYRHHDRHYLFETNCERLQLVICNQGAEPIVDASIALVMPKDDELYVADRLPKVPRDDEFVDRSADEIASYPSVSLHEKSIHISRRI